MSETFAKLDRAPQRLVCIGRRRAQADHCERSSETSPSGIDHGLQNLLLLQLAIALGDLFHVKPLLHHDGRVENPGANERKQPRAKPDCVSDRKRTT